jgi:hypothetical protein
MLTRKSMLFGEIAKITMQVDQRKPISSKYPYKISFRSQHKFIAGRNTLVKIHIDMKYMCVLNIHRKHLLGDSATIVLMMIRARKFSKKKRGNNGCFGSEIH